VSSVALRALRTLITSGMARRRRRATEARAMRIGLASPN
jgi:hypothetical protein